MAERRHCRVAADLVTLEQVEASDAGSIAYIATDGDDLILSWRGPKPRALYGLEEITSVPPTDDTRIARSLAARRLAEQRLAVAIPTKSAFETSQPPQPKELIQ